MQVLIDGKWHDSNLEMIIIELSDREKDQIANMAKGATLYASFPDSMDTSDVREAMVNSKKG